MSELTNKELVDTAKKLFPNEEIASKFVNMMATSRPEGTSKKSSYPYYKEFYARKIQPRIDDMIKGKGSLIFRYAEFCGSGGFSESTLYLFVNQASRYLVERMDKEDLRYFQWKNTSKTTRSKERGGVCIDFLPGFRCNDDVNFTPELVQAIADGTPRWRIDLNEWLENDKATAPFCREGLTLSLEEMNGLKVEMRSVRGVEVSINCKKIMAIKVNV